ncbi:hypothetical protein PENSPDRAFT_648606 [Peniophora sp. CONT]|nr:hypothetical protein PENSPDRAFT_648606 [Peniophora sp. CONT]
MEARVLQWTVYSSLFRSDTTCHATVYIVNPYSADTPASPSERAAHVPVFGALYHPPQRPWYTLASTPQAITPHSEFSSLELPISLSTSPAASDAPSLSNASSDTESAFGSDPSHDTYEPASASVLKLSMPQAMPPHAHSYAPPGFSPNAAHPYMFSPNVGYFPQLPPPPTPIKLDRPPLPRRTTHRKAIAYRSKPCRHWVANETCPKGDLCSLLVPLTKSGTCADRLS